MSPDTLTAHPATAPHAEWRNSSVPRSTERHTALYSSWQTLRSAAPSRMCWYVLPLSLHLCALSGSRCYSPHSIPRPGSTPVRLRPASGSRHACTDRLPPAVPQPPSYCRQRGPHLPRPRRRRRLYPGCLWRKSSALFPRKAVSPSVQSHRCLRHRL